MFLTNIRKKIFSNFINNIKFESVLIFALFVSCPPTFAQGYTIHRLECDGYWGNSRARISGLRRLDSSVNFEGQLQTQYDTFKLVYKINRATAKGILYTNPPASVAVVDNTGGKMKIYDGSPTTGAPQLYGEFVCQWIKVQ